jgi:acetyltransferase-like isoleucine patch superfamily enzyme
MRLSSEEKEKIITFREKFNEFQKSGKKKFSFPVESALETRIRFIYKVIFPGFKRLGFYGRFFIARLAQWTDISSVKKLLYRTIGVKIGRGVFISPDVIIDPHFPRLIEIDEYVILGWGAHLFPHEFSGSKYRVGRIRIKRGAVIGGFSSIRGGVTIGEKADVSSLTIVYRDVPDNFLFDNEIMLKKFLSETGIDIKKNRNYSS